MDGSEFMNMTKRETIAAMAMQGGYHCEPGRFRQNGDFLNQENHQWIEQIRACYRPSIHANCVTP